MPMHDDENFKRMRYGYGTSSVDALTDKYIGPITVQPLGYLFTDLLRTSAHNRVRNNRKYWNFYLDRHFDSMIVDGERKLVVNYVATMLDFTNDFLIGFVPQPWKTVVPAGSEDAKTYLDSVWLRNNWAILAYEMFQMGGITGDLFLQITYEQKDEDFVTDLPEDQRKVKIVVLNSSYVFPEFSATDKDRMVSCLIQYPIFVDEVDAKSGNRVRRMKTFTQYVDKNEIREFVDQNELEDSPRPNPWGEINIVHIKNFPLAGASFGRSDFASLMILQEEFNEKAQDVSEILDYHAAPVTLIYGAKASTIEKGAKKIWGGLPKDARVENLGLDTDLVSSLTYLDRVKLWMHEVGGIPENALGQFQQISNTSAPALHMTYLPLLKKVGRKKATYGPGIAKVNRLILKSGEIFEGLKFSSYVSEVAWFDTLPKDELIEMQIIAQKMALKLLSVQGALADLGEEDPVAVETGIIEGELRWSAVNAITGKNVQAAQAPPEMPQPLEENQGTPGPGGEAA